MLRRLWLGVLALGLALPLFALPVHATDPVWVTSRVDDPALCGIDHPLGDACVSWNRPEAGGAAGLVVSRDGARVYSLGEIDRALHATDAATGALLWSTPRLPVADHGVPLDVAVSPDGARVVVTTGCCGEPLRILAFNAATGAELWRVSDPQSVGNLVFGPRSDVVYLVAGRTMALDMASGAILWATGSLVIGQLDTYDLYGSPQRRLAADATRLYLGGRQIGALDPATGAVLWTFDPTPITADRTPNQIILDGADGLLLVVGGDFQTAAAYALDLASGQLKWSVPVRAECAALAGGILVAGGDFRYGIRASDGVLLYSTPGNPFDGYCNHAIAGRGFVVMADSGGVSGIDPQTGRRAWAVARGESLTVGLTASGFVASSRFSESVYGIALREGLLDATS